MRTPILAHAVGVVFCLLCVSAIIVHIRESPVNGGDSRIGNVELLTATTAKKAAHHPHESKVDAAEQEDVIRAKKESEAAKLEMAKSRVVQAEASLDEDRAKVANVATRLASAQARINTLRTKAQREQAAEGSIAKREAKIRKLEAADKLAEKSLREEATSHAANIPLLLARVPAEKKQIKQLQKKALGTRRSELTLQEKHAELQQSTVSTLESAISQEEDAQTQFALAKAQIARAKAKELTAVKEANKAKHLSATLPTLQKEAKAATLKFKLLDQENDAKTDAVRALKLRVEALKKKMAALARRTGISPPKALADVEEGRLVRAPQHVSVSNSNKDKEDATPEEVLKVVRGVKKSGRSSSSKKSTASRLRSLAEDADIATAKADRYRKQLQQS